MPFPDFLIINIYFVQPASEQYVGKNPVLMMTESFTKTKSVKTVICKIWWKYFNSSSKH